MNQQVMEKMGESITVSFIAGRALMVLSQAQKEQPINVDRCRKSLQDAIEFMKNVNDGRDVFKGNSLSGRALHASTAYDTALRAMRSAANSLLSQSSLEDIFMDIQKSLEGLLHSKQVDKDKIQLSRDFFSSVACLFIANALSLVNRFFLLYQTTISLLYKTTLDFFHCLSYSRKTV